MVDKGEEDPQVVQGALHALPKIHPYRDEREITSDDWARVDA